MQKNTYIIQNEFPGEKKPYYPITEVIKHRLTKITTPYFKPKKKNKKACNKKKRYPTMTFAKQVIKRRQEVAPDIYLRAYQCDLCRWCHITSQTEEEHIAIVMQREVQLEAIRMQRRKAKRCKK